MGMMEKVGKDRSFFMFLLPSSDAHNQRYKIKMKITITQIETAIIIVLRYLKVQKPPSK